MRSRWDNALLVGGREAVGDLQGVIDRLSRGERSGAQPRAQRLALEQLHDGVHRRAMPPEVMDGENVGMREGGHDLGLTLEASEGGGILGEMRREHLNGDVAAELRVTGAVDLAHPAGAERADDLVRTERDSRSEGHWRAVG